MEKDIALQEFEPLPFWKEALLPKEELADYYRDKRQHDYINNIELNLKWREKIHPILLELISLNRKYIDKQTLTIIGDKRKETNKPIIFAITHIGKFDYQIVSEAIRDHQIPFSGDPETMYRTLDGLFLNLNGIVYCDTESKTDRHIAKETSQEMILKKNKNLAIYPEGVWNVTTDLLVLPLFPGIIDMAKETDAEIVPVAVEQYGKDFIVNIGENMVVQSDKDNKEVLRDTLATLKWKIMESRSKFTKEDCVYEEKRENLGDYEEEKEKFINERLNEWVNPKTGEPYYNAKIISERTFKEKNKETGLRIDLPDDAFDYFNNLKLNKNNAFMFRNDLSLPNDIQRKIKERIREEIESENYFLEDTLTDNRTK